MSVTNRWQISMQIQIFENIIKKIEPGKRKNIKLFYLQIILWIFSIVFRITRILCDLRAILQSRTSYECKKLSDLVIGNWEQPGKMDRTLDTFRFNPIYLILH